MSYRLNPFTGRLDYYEVGGSGGALDDLSDVSTSGESTNDVLMFNGSEWVAVPEGTTFTFSVSSFSDGVTSPVLIGTGEWKAIGALTFTASYSNGPATAAHVDKTAPGWTNDLTFSSPYTSKASTEVVNYPVSPGSITFALHTMKGAETSNTSLTITFWDYFYYGGSTLQTGWSATQIKALIENPLANVSTGTWNTVTLGANEYFVFAYPSRLTAPTNWYDNSTSFPLSLKSLTPEVVSITNANGYTENYDVFVSNQILGPGNFQLRTN
jgi:hypothetical protein